LRPRLMFVGAAIFDFGMRHSSHILRRPRKAAKPVNGQGVSPPELPDSRCG
jgi:hypothetical protein